MRTEQDDAAPTFEIFNPHNLLCMDETVREVFGVQLGIDITNCTPPAAMDNKSNRRNEQTALIGFAGTISGLCEIRLTIPAAIVVTQAMLPGANVAEGSEWICDAVGELCNLLAGGWKNRLPELGASCSLTIPTVIAGDVYQIHRPANLLVNRRSYTFCDNHLLLLTLVCEPG